MWKREREVEGGRDRLTRRQTDTEKEKDRQTQGDRERQTDRQQIGRLRTRNRHRTGARQIHRHGNTKK